MEVLPDLRYRGYDLERKVPSDSGYTYYEGKVVLTSESVLCIEASPKRLCELVQIRDDVAKAKQAKIAVVDWFESGNLTYLILGIGDEGWSFKIKWLTERSKQFMHRVANFARWITGQAS